jgi:hypothetical protein
MTAIGACAHTEEWRNVMETFWGIDVDPELECNSGGPMSRSRELTLRATILGEGSDGICCPKVRQAALDFGGEDPVPYVHRLSEGLGYPSPEAAREALMHLSEPFVCFVSKRVKPLRVSRAPPEAVLETALILGLSTSSVFDPARPVIWTRTSLTRRLALYDIMGFYS